MPITEEYRRGVKNRLLKELSHSEGMGLTDLSAAVGHARGFVNNLMIGLEKEGKAYRTVKEKKRIWDITENGKHTILNDWTELHNDISNMVKNNGSYLRLYQPLLWSATSPNPTGLISDIAMTPKNLEQSVNFIELENELRKGLLEFVLKNLLENKKDVPANSKLLLAVQVISSNIQSY